MATEINGSLIINELSLDNGVTWKRIICETDSEMTLSADVNETKTKCATYTAVEPGAVSISGNGVNVGDLLPGEIAFLGFAALLNNKTKFLFRRYNLASGSLALGEITYMKAYCYATELSESAPTGEVNTFSWGVQSTGVVDFDPAS